jgi:hypothetical protein
VKYVVISGDASSLSNRVLYVPSRFYSAASSEGLAGRPGTVVDSHK